MNFNPIRFGNAYPTQRTAAAVKFGLKEIVILKTELPLLPVSSSAAPNAYPASTPVQVLGREKVDTPNEEVLLKRTDVDAASTRRASASDFDAATK